MNEEGGINLQLIFGPEDIVYWVEFTQDELENQETFSKMVRRGKRFIELCYVFLSLTVR